MEAKKPRQLKAWYSVSKKIRRTTYALLIVFTLIMFVPLAFSIGLISGFIVIPPVLRAGSKREIRLGDAINVGLGNELAGSILSMDINEVGGIVLFPEIEFDKSNPLMRVFVEGEGVMGWNITTFKIDEPGLVDKNNSGMQKAETSLTPTSAGYGGGLQRTSLSTSGEAMTVFSVPLEIGKVDAERVFTKIVEVIKPAGDEEVNLVFNNVDESIIPSPQGLTAGSYFVSPSLTNGAFLTMENLSHINFVNSSNVAKIIGDSSKVCVGEVVCFDSEGMNTGKTSIVNGWLSIGTTTISPEATYIQSDFTVDVSISAVLILRDLKLSGSVHLSNSVVSSTQELCGFTGPKNERSQYTFSNGDGTNNEAFDGLETGKIIFEEYLELFAEQDNYNGSTFMLGVSDSFKVELSSENIVVSDVLELGKSLTLNSQVDIGPTVKHPSSLSSLLEYKISGAINFRNQETKLVGSLRSLGSSLIINGVDISGPGSLFVSKLESGEMQDDTNTLAKVAFVSPMVVFDSPTFTAGIKLENEFVITESINSNSLPLDFVGSNVTVGGEMGIISQSGSVAFKNAKTSNSIVFNNSGDLVLDVPVVSSGSILVSGTVTIGDFLKIKGTDIEYSDVLSIGSENISVQVSDVGSASSGSSQIKYKDFAVGSLLIGSNKLIENDTFAGAKLTIAGNSALGTYVDGFDFYEKFKMNSNLWKANELTLGGGYNSVAVNSLKLHKLMVFNNIVYGAEGITFENEDGGDLTIGKIIITDSKIQVDDNLVFEGLRVPSFTLGSDVEIKNTKYGTTQAQRAEKESYIMLTDLALHNPSQNITISKRVDAATAVLNVTCDVEITKPIRFSDSSLGLDTIAPTIKIHNKLVVNKEAQTGAVTESVNYNTLTLISSEGTKLILGKGVESDYLHFDDTYTSSLDFSGMVISLNKTINVPSESLSCSVLSFSGTITNIKNTVNIDGQAIVDQRSDGGTQTYTFDRVFEKLDFERIFVEELEINNIVTNELRLFSDVTDLTLDPISQQPKTDNLIAHIYANNGSSLTGVFVDLLQPTGVGAEIPQDFVSNINIKAKELYISTPLQIGELSFSGSLNVVAMERIGGKFVETRSLNFDNSIKVSGLGDTTDNKFEITANSIDSRHLVFENIRVVGQKLLLNNNLVFKGDSDVKSLLTLTGNSVRTEHFSVSNGEVFPTYPVDCNQRPIAFSSVGACRAFIINVNTNITGNLTNHHFDIIDADGGLEGFELVRNTLKANNFILFKSSDPEGVVTMYSEGSSFEGTKFLFGGVPDTPGSAGPTILDGELDASFESIYAERLGLPKRLELGLVSLESNVPGVSGSYGITLSHSAADDGSTVVPFYLNSTSIDATDIFFASPITVDEFVWFGDKVTFIQDSDPLDKDGIGKSIILDASSSFISSSFLKFGKYTVENDPDTPIQMDEAKISADSTIVVDAVGSSLEDVQVNGVDGHHINIGRTIANKVTVSSLLNYTPKKNTDGVQDGMDKTTSFVLEGQGTNNLLSISSGFVYIPHLTMGTAGGEDNSPIVKLSGEQFIENDTMKLDRIIGTVAADSLTIGRIKFAPFADDDSTLSVSIIPNEDKNDSESIAIVVDNDKVVKLDSVVEDSLGTANTSAGFARLITHNSERLVSFDFFGVSEEARRGIFSVSRSDITQPVLVDGEIGLRFMSPPSEGRPNFNHFQFSVPDLFKFSVGAITSDLFVGDVLLLENSSFAHFSDTTMIGSTQTYDGETYRMININRDETEEDAHTLHLEYDISINSGNGQFTTDLIHFVDNSGSNSMVSNDKIKVKKIGAVKAPKILYPKESEISIESHDSKSVLKVISHLTDIKLSGVDGVILGKVDIKGTNEKIGITMGTGRAGQLFFFNMSDWYLNTGSTKPYQNESDCLTSLSSSSPESTCSKIVFLKVPQMFSINNKEEEEEGQQVPLIFLAKHIEVDRLKTLGQSICSKMRYEGDHYNMNRYKEENVDEKLTLSLIEEKTEPDLVVSDKLLKVSTIQNAKVTSAEELCFGTDWGSMFLYDVAAPFTEEQKRAKSVCIKLDAITEDSPELGLTASTNADKKGLTITAGQAKWEAVNIDEESSRFNGIRVRESLRTHRDSLASFSLVGGVLSGGGGDYKERSTVDVENVDELRFCGLKAEQFFTPSNVTVKSSETNAVDTVNILVDSRRFPQPIQDDIIDKVSQTPYVALGTTTITIGGLASISDGTINLLKDDKGSVDFGCIQGEYHELHSEGGIALVTKGTVRAERIRFSSLFIPQALTDTAQPHSFGTIKQTIVESGAAKDVLSILDAAVTCLGFLNFKSIDAESVRLGDVTVLSDGVGFAGGSVVELIFGGFSFHKDGRLSAGGTSLGNVVQANTLTFSPASISIDKPICLKSESIAIGTLETTEGCVALSSILESDTGSNKVTVTSLHQGIFSYDGNDLKYCDDSQPTNIRIKGMGINVESCTKGTKSVTANKFVFDIDRMSAGVLAFETQPGSLRFDKFGLTGSLEVGGVTLIGADGSINMNSLSDVSSYSTDRFSCVGLDGDNLLARCPITTNVSSKIGDVSVLELKFADEEASTTFSLSQQSQGSLALNLEGNDTSIVFKQGFDATKFIGGTVNATNMTFDAKMLGDDVVTRVTNISLPSMWLMLINTQMEKGDLIDANTVVPYCGSKVRINFTDEFSFLVEDTGPEGELVDFVGKDVCGMRDGNNLNVTIDDNGKLKSMSTFVSRLHFRNNNKRNLVIEGNEEETCAILKNKEEIGNLLVSYNQIFQQVHTDLQLRLGTDPNMELFVTQDNVKYTNSNIGLVIHNLRTNETNGLDSMTVKMASDFKDQLGENQTIPLIPYLTYETFNLKMKSSTTLNMVYKRNGSRKCEFKTVRGAGAYKITPMESNLVYIAVFKRTGDKSLGPKYKIRFFSKDNLNTDEIFGKITLTSIEGAIEATIEPKEGYTVSVMTMNDISG